MTKEYIERETLKAWLHEEDFGTPDERWRPESEFGAMIDALPAADVVEVVHGAWENIKDFGNGNCFGYCSVCGTDHKATGIADLMFSFKYCRWCGAKMDGERKERG